MLGTTESMYQNDVEEEIPLDDEDFELPKPQSESQRYPEYFECGPDYRCFDVDS